MGVQENIKRGTLELLLLALLVDQDMYGYQICQEIEKRSEGKVTLQEGSAYPILYRLKEKGMITEYKKLAGKRRTRVYYHLTPEGLTHMQALKSEYLEIQEGIEKILKSVQSK